MRIISTIALSVLTLSSFANCLAPLEPADGQVLLGAWVDSVPEVGDSPLKFNQRLGRNAAFFQFSEDIPLDFDKPIPIELLHATNTNADLYVTIYPPRNSARPYDAITDQAILDLGRQIAGYVVNGQRTFIRLFPEMNGNWNTWGQQPVAYKSAWKRVAADLRNRLAGFENRYALIWAPSIAQTAESVAGYPFTGSTIWRSGASNVTEFDELDTNKDGKFDRLDDPYSPYYPGDDVVDWVGASIYYYGTTWPWTRNQPVPAGSFDSIMRGYGKYTDLYAEYSVKHGKPMMITETAAAFHLEMVDAAWNNVSMVDPGIGELAIKRQFWSQYITNPAYLDAHPKIKAICLFEFAKVEESTYRDFRITTDENILNTFKADLEHTMSRFVWASPASDSGRIDSGQNVPHANGTVNGIEPLDFWWLLLFLLVVVIVIV